ncbi:MAG: hypothetical protein CMP40_00830 [Rickettsiales bacterium]|nr:hypothetical protein [Rickettsiales bacterium]
MVKESINNNLIYQKIVFFLGNDIHIFRSLKEISLNTGSFIIQKNDFKENMLKSCDFVLLDDSTEHFKEIIKYFYDLKYNKFFIILKKENAELFINEKYKFFYKPVKIYDLYEEICNRISHNTKKSNKWQLDRSTLQLFLNQENNIKLTEKEYYFIYYLLDSKSEYISKKNLLKKVWKINMKDETEISDSRVVETLVSKIRKKLSYLKNGPKILKNEKGYKLLI